MKKIIMILAALTLLLQLAACGEQDKSSENHNTDTNVQASQQTIESAPDKKWINIYFNYINNVKTLKSMSGVKKQTVELPLSSLWYFIDDINYDGVADLVITNQQGKGNGFKIYTYKNNNIEILCESDMPYSNGVETLSLAKYKGKYGILRHRQSSDNNFTFTTIDYEGNTTPILSGSCYPDWKINDKILSESEWNSEFNSIQSNVNYWDFETFKSQADQTKETTKTTQKYSNVIFSSTIGEVDGKIYCARKTGYEIGENGVEQIGKIIAEPIPVETGEYGIIASFCYYNGYVYYVESEGGTSDYSTWLYRCKSDWSGKELLYSDDINSPSYGEREFIIDNNILYYGSYDPDKEVETIDLLTMKTSKGNMPRYNLGDETNMAIYNGKLFFIDENGNLYVEEDGNKRFLASDAYFDGGLAGDDFYYVEYNYEVDKKARLYKISLTGGEKELIDSTMPVGGGGPYFCW